MITLQPMNEEEFNQYISYAIKDYANEKIVSGNWSEEEAIDLSRESFEKNLPENEKTANNHLFSVFHNEIVVGMIWIFQKAPLNPTEGFIYDFVIFDQYQGQGYGKKTMKELELIAKELGITKIGLHVFGHNKIASGLYKKMGYEITNITMSKTI